MRASRKPDRPQGPDDSPAEQATLDDVSHARGAPFFDFCDTRRFTIVRRIGAGGMGVVYEAMDRERNEPVALKTLIGVDPHALYRFKQEFRSVADVTHPNLVVLHELFSEGDQMFFSMELVDGVPFLAHVVEEREGKRLLSVTRLRAAMRQLAEGVQAIHTAGKLHRDLKPTNVLVTREGRVVILDFGLARDLDVAQSTAQGSPIGTPAYMAPEQARGKTVTTAADWYAVGVMLYECLTGMRPFRGTTLEVLIAKQDGEPPPPSTIVERVPTDLDQLCMELLRRQPSERPSGRDVLRRLIGSGAVEAVIEPDRSVPIGLAPFVGRAHHVEVLQDALAATRDGRTVALRVHGNSGMGKTALVRHFLDRIRQADEALVLTGRCYERESVPYKALDSLIDSLCRYLVSLPEAQVQALLPRDVRTLARLFPVLLRVDAIAQAPRRSTESPDPKEIRRRAFAALKELLARAADRRTLVLHIDDLQWGDVDSAAPLVQLLSPPDAPALLLIASYRTEEAAASPVVQALPQPDVGLPDVLELEVGPLDRNEARDLALELLGEEAAGAAERASAIADESEGSPLFVGELVRHSEARRASVVGPGSGDVRLRDVLRARFASLTEGARRLLEAIAVAGGPVEQGVAFAAAGSGPAGRAFLSSLRSEHLVRTRGASDRDAVEIYHDRIREALVGEIDEEHLQRQHLSLAHALAETRRADPEVLASQFRDGGKRADAGTYAAEAARQAATSLAFHRAVRLFRLALELLAANDDMRASLLVGLGDALTNAGRSLEGAAAYLDAAEHMGASGADEATGVDGLELRRRAADQLLRGGKVEDGLRLAREVLKAVGMHIPGGPRRAIASLIARSVTFRMRGLSFHERAEHEIPAEELRRIDTCAALPQGLGGVNIVIAWDFSIRQTLLALRAGEPARIARSLAQQAVFTSLAGGAGNRQCARMLAKAQELAVRVDNPHALGLVAMATGMSPLYQGRFREAVAHCEHAAEIFRSRCVGVPWETGVTQLFVNIALFFLGELRELARRKPQLVAEARERDDLFFEVGLRMGRSSIVDLLADDVEDVRREIDSSIERWSKKDYQAHHYWALLAHVQTDLYAGEGRRAYERMANDWPLLERFNLTRIQMLRLEALHLRACAALAAAEGGHAPADMLRSAQRDAREILRHRMPWSDPLAHLILAGVAHCRGEQDVARRGLEQALTGLEAADLRLWVAATQRRLGILEGGSIGQASIEAGDSFMVAQDVRDFAPLTAMLVPGFGP